MRTIILLIILDIIIVIQIYGQSRDTIIFNRMTKNYQVYYSTKLTYAQSQDGTLRRVNLDDYLEEDEKLVEKDTLISFIFEPAIKVMPEVHCVMHFNQDSGIYFYNYTIYNGVSAEQPIDYLILSFGESARVSSRTDNFWRNQQRYRGGGLQLDQKWAWSGGGETTPVSEIMPGQKMDGFMISSNSAPGVFTVVFQGRTNYLNDLPFDISYSPIKEQLLELAFGSRNFVSRSTIAPSNPLVMSGIIQGLDTLQYFIQKSVALKWLTFTPDHDCDTGEKSEDGVAGNLGKYIQKIRTCLTNGDTSKAVHDLNKFIKKVERIYKRSEAAAAKSDSNNVAMTSEAYALLKYNAEYLVGQLVVLPKPSQGSLLNQIDSLKIEIQSQGKAKTIGGTILTKSLTLLCDQAKRELQKADSSGAANYIALVQSVVDETREITEKLEENKKKMGLLYVSADGYIPIYYRAKYILEALPEPRLSLLQLRKELLDPEVQKELDIQN